MATRKTRRPAKKATRTAAASGRGSTAKTGENSKLPGINVKAILASQRKDLEALAKANREVYEGMKALAKRNNNMLREALVEWRAAMRQTRGKGALGRRAAIAQKGIKQAIANFRELAAMEAATRRKAWRVLQDRFQENLVNLQKLLRRE